MVRDTRMIDRGLLFIRVALGIVFVMHGGQKLFVFGYEGVTGAMAGMGLPVPAVSAAAIIAVELLGGLSLLSGTFTRVFAFLLAGAMGVATVALAGAPSLLVALALVALRTAFVTRGE